MATYCNCNALNIDECKDRQIDNWTESERERQQNQSTETERGREKGGGARGKTRY